MNRVIQVIMLAIVFVIPVSTYAHDGHGVYQGGDIRHYLLSSEHALPIVAMVATLVFILVKMTQLIRKNSMEKEATNHS